MEDTGLPPYGARVNVWRGEAQPGAETEAVGHGHLVTGPGTVFGKGAQTVAQHGVTVLRLAQPVQPVGMAVQTQWQ